MGASGLAAVWAESNTRKLSTMHLTEETFATTGSRIKVRFFAGYEIDNALSAEVHSFAYEEE